MLLLTDTESPGAAGLGRERPCSGCPELRGLEDPVAQARGPTQEHRIPRQCFHQCCALQLSSLWHGSHVHCPHRLKTNGLDALKTSMSSHLPKALLRPCFVKITRVIYCNLKAQHCLTEGFSFPTVLKQLLLATWKKWNFSCF